MTPSVETLTRFLTLLSNTYTTTEIKPRIYSGRGMYGAQCLGVVTDDPLIFMFELGEMSYEIKSEESDDEYNSEHHELVQLLNDCSSNICQDSMGLSSIVYFPNIKLTFENHSEAFEEYSNEH